MASFFPALDHPDWLRLVDRGSREEGHDEAVNDFGFVLEKGRAPFIGFVLENLAPLNMIESKRPDPSFSTIKLPILPSLTSISRSRVGWVEAQYRQMNIKLPGSKR